MARVVMKPLVVTAGHAATDPGAVRGDVREALMTLWLRDAVARELRGMGVPVLTDGAPGENAPLSQAIALIARGQLAVEFHVNASTNPQASGTEALSLPAKKHAAQTLAQAAARALGLRVRGEAGWQPASSSPRGRLGYVEAGGVILETHFLSNPQDQQAWETRREALASQLARTLLELGAQAAV